MNDDHRRVAMDLVGAALSAVDPEAAVEHHLGLDGARLRIGEHCSVDLEQVDRVLVVGGGKAVVPMSRAVETVLGARLSSGLVLAKANLIQGELPGNIEVAQAAHPVPDPQGLSCTKRMIDLLTDLGPRDLVLCLISGGGSSLMTLPVEGLELFHLQRLNEELLAAGAPITAINTIRKHLSRIKGGQLAALARPARVVSLILSDVVGDHLDVIASGPTAPDPTTYADALDLLDSYGLSNRLPGAILDHLRAGRAGQHPETPKPGDALFERVYNVIIGSNRLAAEAAQRRAVELGLNSKILSTGLQGEARQVGKDLATTLRDMATNDRPLPRPACLVAGGETTVTLTGSVGKGGRNQELALSASLELEGLEDVLLVALATDGNDGPTDAGGALVDGTTVARGRAAGLVARDHLAGHDAYPFFEALGDLLMLGPTGTNVNDVDLLLAF